MRTNLFFVAIILVLCFFAPVTSANMHIKEDWDIEDGRSLISIPPTVLLTNQTLSIQIYDSIPNLMITIYDENEEVVHQNVISYTGRGIQLISLDSLTSGKYRILLKNKFGSWSCIRTVL